MDSGLPDVARWQGGAFTVRQAMAAGYSRDAIRHRVSIGRWRRAARGILAPAVGPRADTPAALAQQAWILLLAHPGAVAGYGLAAGLHGLATYRPVAGCELVRPAGPSRTPGYDGVAVTVADLPGDHVAEPHGVPATSLARTAADLARRGSLRDGCVALDSALRLGATRDELDAVAGACSGWPGSRALRLALDVADEGSESPLESIAHVVQNEQGLPRARTQVELHDDAGFIGRVDDFWPEFATVGETDGLAKYDEPGSLRNEKLRQERLERAGLQVVRVTHADLTRAPEATAVRYREAFERCLQRLSWRPLTVRVGASPARWGLRAG